MSRCLFLLRRVGGLLASAGSSARREGLPLQCASTPSHYATVKRMHLDESLISN